MDGLWHRPLLEQDYALINPLQVDSDLWADLPTAVIAPPELEAFSGLMPRLLNLNVLSAEHRLQLFDRAEVQRRHNPRAPYFSALLISNLSFHQILQRLADRLVVRGPTQNAALLRYYDPRVFQHLRWILTQSQMDSLMLGIECWSWNSGGHTWGQFRPRGRASQSAIRLSESQWGHLQRLALINRCMRNLGINTEGDADSDSIARHISKLLQESYEQRGLSQAEDRCRYAEQGIRSIQGQLQEQGMS